MVGVEVGWLVGMGVLVGAMVEVGMDRSRVWVEKD